LFPGRPFSDRPRFFNSLFLAMQNLEHFFLLRKDITYLNFGAFGACVKPVFERYQAFQKELEEDPTQFYNVKGPGYLAASRESLGNYLDCNMDDVVYVTNPSYAVNAVARSFNLQPGDEVLSTALEYGACDRTWDYYCIRAGARFVRQALPMPLKSKEEFAALFCKGITNKTKLVFISHVTSSTGLRLPVEEIAAIVKAKGILTFVDGAHAPGQIQISLKNSNFDFYTGACHKWMLTPKGSSFLYVKKEYQQLVDPLVISWGYKALFPSSSGFIDYHQLNGTRDYAAFLSVPTAIGFMKEHEWGYIAAACRQLVKERAPDFSELLETPPLALVNDDFLLQLYSAEIKTREPEKLQRHLYENYKIVIPVMRHGDKIYIRYSINAFNNPQDLDKLFNAVKEIKKETDLIG
jgi:isopenicillin-N epimerase